MGVSLRKSCSHLHVSYTDEDYSNNLSGTDFCLNSSNEANSLSINLVGNLTQRNKQTNSYSDALDLIEKHSMLEQVQIDEQVVIEGLLKAYKTNPSATWYLELSFGEKGCFKYQIKPSLENGSVFLDIVSV